MFGMILQNWSEHLPSPDKEDRQQGLGMEHVFLLHIRQPGSCF